APFAATVFLPGISQRQARDFCLALAWPVNGWHHRNTPYRPTRGSPLPGKRKAIFAGMLAPLLSPFAHRRGPGKKLCGFAGVAPEFAGGFFAVAGGVAGGG